jgi:predicted Zn-dependent protease
MASATASAATAITASPGGSKATPAAGPAVKKPHYSEQTLADILTAEVAAQQGHLNKALALYVKQATATNDVELIEQAAHLALYMQQAKTALDMTHLWLAQEPDNLDAWQTTTYAHVLQGLPDTVTTDISKQLALQPKTALNDLLADSGQLSKDQLQVLLMALSNLASQYPGQAPLWFARALVKQANGQYQTALDACNHALDINPTHLESQLLKAQLLVQLKRPKDALKLLKKQESKHPDKSQVAIAYIHLLLQMKDNKEAGRQLIRFNKRFPDDQDMRFALALFSLQQGNSKAAIPVLESLLAEDYQPDDVHLYLGRALEMQADWQTAIDNYLQVEGKYLLQARVAAAQLLYQHKQDSAAAKLFAEMRKLHPDEADSLYAAQASLLAEQKQQQALWNLLKEALTAYPKNADLLYMRAMEEGRRNNIPAMEKDLNTILANDPNNINALNALGYTLSNHSNRYQEAWYYIKRAHAQEPDNPAILDSLGWVLYRLKRYDEALPLLQQSYAAIDDPEVASHLIQVLRAVGQNGQASKLLHQMLVQHPDNPFLTPLATSGIGKS